jgi:hypothetical protein
MRCHGRLPIIMVLISLVIWSVSADATEWTVGQPIAPGIASIGEAAVQFNNALYLFVSTGSEVLYQHSLNGADWLPGYWKRLAIDTDAPPVAVVFSGKLYLFTKARKSNAITYRMFDGQSWTTPSKSMGTSSVAPAATAGQNALFLVMTGNGGKIQYRTLTGSKWSASNTLSSKTSKVSPAVAAFNSKIFVVVTAPNGSVSYMPIGSKSWNDVGTVGKADQLALAVSNNRLFIFGREADGSVWFRILDQTHGRDDFVPVDEWMPAGDGYAESPLSAGTLGDSIFLFYRKNQVIPGPGFLRSAPAVFYKTASWTDVPIAVVQGADPDCTNKANLANVSTWVSYASSAYAPLMVRFNWKTTVTKCGYQWQATDPQGKETWDKGGTPNENVLATDPGLSGKVWVAVRARASGGAFSGYSGRIVAMPEDMSVCTSKGQTDFNFYNNQLAHELGHYFGLNHTFNDPIGVSKSSLQATLASKGFDPVAAFDKDAAWNMYFDAQSSEFVKIYDTPPDPNHEINGVSEDKCTNTYAPVLFTGPSNNKSCTSDTQCIGAETCISGKCEISLIPPRLNTMSYYQVSGTVINKFSPGQAAVIYQALRARGFAPGEPYSPAKP